jgi:midasin
MNPSGDYGKKELSPALRNRFTEIWVEPITHPEYIKNAESDIIKMVNHKLDFPEEIKYILSSKIYEFLIEYNCNVAPRYNLTRKLLTMRDIGWICKFINDSNFTSW